MDGEGFERPAGGAAHVCVQRASASLGDDVLLRRERRFDARDDSELVDGRSAHAVAESGDARGARAALVLGGGGGRVRHELLDARRGGGAEVGGEWRDGGRGDEAAVVSE